MGVSDRFFATRHLTERVTEKGNSDVEYTFHLFVRPKDPKAELWDGARSGIQAAQDVFNADEAGDINQCQSILPDIIHSAKEVYTDILGNARPKSAFSRFFAGSSTAKAEGFQKLLHASNVKALRPLINQLRVNKSEAEILNMRRAGQDSGRVFSEAMREQFATEKELWATLDFGFRMQGLDGSAYVPVVAGAQVCHGEIIVSSAMLTCRRMG